MHPSYKSTASKETAHSMHLSNQTIGYIKDPGHQQSQLEGRSYKPTPTANGPPSSGATFGYEQSGIPNSFAHSKPVAEQPSKREGGSTSYHPSSYTAIVPPPSGAAYGYDRSIPNSFTPVAEQPTSGRYGSDGGHWQPPKREGGSYQQSSYTANVTLPSGATSGYDQSRIPNSFTQSKPVAEQPTSGRYGSDDGYLQPSKREGGSYQPSSYTGNVPPPSGTTSGYNQSRIPNSFTQSKPVSEQPMSSYGYLRPSKRESGSYQPSAYTGNAPPPSGATSRVPNSFTQYEPVAEQPTSGRYGSDDGYWQPSKREGGSYQPSSYTANMPPPSGVTSGYDQSRIPNSFTQSKPVAEQPTSGRYGSDDSYWQPSKREGGSYQTSSYIANEPSGQTEARSNRLIARAQFEPSKGTAQPTNNKATATEKRGSNTSNQPTKIQQGSTSGDKRSVHKSKYSTH
ncbi:hypothetical protein SCLCIDRAFT_1206899 [Scleroderma citrinum Foug A]|uniref:Uncharacterized protein n=1 Tax=Scleroderma citrinum Foug A TaxID=1036808 RepID=A0A0C3B0F4_9AGAM|nr:hypothetical protein SCLCIDRAFT_1206899 [Scleroderma citrinum Foug A]